MTEELIKSAYIIFEYGEDCEGYVEASSQAKTKVVGPEAQSLLLRPVQGPVHSQEGARGAQDCLHVGLRAEEWIAA